MLLTTPIFLILLLGVIEGINFVWRDADNFGMYDEELGWPDDGIEPGTKWDDVPEDWLCPDCGVGKEDFEMTEI